MPGISRQGLDSAGGTLLGGGQNFVRLAGAAVILIGDPVAGHGTGGHAAPTMVQGSPFVRIGGVAVCRAGHAASCGHAATGAAFARIST